ncbi:MAG: VIT1/CCC1 transporter family protein [Phaeodactylibacter sp.]|nr:VIT1/CCC1 transporter family protein [Phaeodactylibacter sp.]MCB9265926.1 VIT1/CCC1 transporter family protein [Lewinellaceae bacterium]MCB9289718.1 VIT1/CCC1 transporter family protein [Lewinellaceae bacterium]
MKHQEARLHGDYSFFNRYQDYLGEFVYGGIDGSVTTFAVVAGAVGASLDSSVILILGFANLLADGFSMSVGAYLSAKSERANYEKHKKIEQWEVKHIPEAEREEIRDIYRQKGFKGALLEKVVDVICSDKDRWVEEMMKDELGMMQQTRSPFRIGLVTYMAFLMVGFIPLALYLWDFIFGFDGNLFLTTCILTGLGFAAVGWLKTYVTETSHWKGILETIILGAVAAGVAYLVGDVLEKVIVGG